MEQAHEAQNGTKSVSEYRFVTKTLDAVHFQEACLSNNISNNYIIIIIRRIFIQDIHFNKLKLLLLMCVLCPKPKCY